MLLQLSPGMLMACIYDDAMHHDPGILPDNPRSRTMRDPILTKGFDGRLKRVLRTQSRRWSFRHENYDISHHGIANDGPPTKPKHSRATRAPSTSPVLVLMDSQPPTSKPLEGPAMSEDTFINYTHPRQQHDKENRKKVATYIGTHFRNRSRPALRNATKTAANEGLDTSNEPPESLSTGSDLGTQLLHTTIHRDSYGLRNDPFSSYPIELTDCIPGAIDYFLNFYAPTHIIRPELITAEQSTPIIKQYFQYALSHELLFESIVALAQMNLTAKDWMDNSRHAGSIAPDRAALFHYGQALAKLREMLNDEDALREDAVLFAIATLMGIDYLLGNLSSFEAHLGGLRKIIRMRGGVDALGWPTLLKPLLSGLETIWTYLKQSPMLLGREIQTRDAFSGSIVSRSSGSGSNSPTESIFTRQPTLDTLDTNWLALRASFSPDALGWTSLSDPPWTSDTSDASSSSGFPDLRYLPPGFRVLALSKTPRLSLPAINLIHRISTIDALLHHGVPSSLITRHGEPIIKKHDNAANFQELEYCLQLLASPELSKLERTICMAILTVLMDSTRTERMSEIWDKQSQANCQIVLQEMNDDSEWNSLDEDEKNCYVWSALNMAGTIVPPRSWNQRWPNDGGRGDIRFELAVRVVREYGRYGRGRTWEEMENMLTAFFWTDGCVESWRNMWGLAVRHLAEQHKVQET